jgi:hypothetical protein
LLIGASASIENGASDLDDIRRQAVVTNRILRNELEQRGLMKIVGAFEYDVLVDDARMTLEVVAQPVNVTIVEQVDGSTKSHVVDALVMGSIKRIARRVCDV